MIQIKNQFTHKIIHQGDFDTIKECVEDAVRKGISLAFANLRGVNLIDANLSNANLIGANLSGANLSNANLMCADLFNANLINTKMPDKPVILPSIGEAVIGFKKLRYDIVIKVEIPADAQRVSTWLNRKCRASALRVLEVVSFGYGRCEQIGLPHNPQNIPTDNMPGLYDPGFVYRLGELHHPDRFDPDERYDCLPGLHFFMTLEEAQAWG